MLYFILNFRRCVFVTYSQIMYTQGKRDGKKTKRKKHFYIFAWYGDHARTSGSLRKFVRVAVPSTYKGNIFNKTKILI